MYCSDQEDTLSRCKLSVNSSILFYVVLVMKRRLTSHICLGSQQWAGRVAEKLERETVGNEILNNITFQKAHS